MKSIKINLGCGWRDFGKDWIHIDGGDYPHLDSKDIFNLPYKNNSIDLIYASHVIEYFSREEIIPILLKWKDKLKPGGIVRLAVPNFEVMSRLYQEGKYSLDRFLGPLYGKMEMGDKTIYHKTTYDYNSLSAILHHIEFNDIRKWDFTKTEHSMHDDHSQAFLPHMDKENGIHVRLNIQCKK